MYYIAPDDASLTRRYSTGMAKHSANGASPDVAQDESDNLSPFERFERLTKHLLTVPKDELDRRVERAKRASPRRAAHKSRPSQ